MMWSYPTSAAAGEECLLGYRAIAIAGLQPKPALFKHSGTYLSIDENVSRPTLNHSFLRRPEPTWTGANHALWNSYEDLTRWLSDSASYPIGENWAIYEFGLWRDLSSIVLLDCLHEEQGVNFLGPHLGDSDDTGSRGVLLGYDVADQGQVSAIHNVSFKPSEQERIRAAFQAHLNEDGLFVDPVLASQFATVASTLCPEHAPFFIYSIRIR